MRASARRSVRVSATAVALGLALPPTGAAAAEEPATAPSPSPAPAPPRTWDEVLAEEAPPQPTAPAPASPPAPAPPPVAAPAPASAPVPARPTDAWLADTRQSARGLLIAAGITGAVATVLNGLRVYIVNVPCQTDDQNGCSLGWFMTTPFTWGANISSAALAGAGGRELGIHDGWVRPDVHRRRTPLMLSFGIPLVALGVGASIALRGLWLADYSDPEGDEVFDFSRPGDAFAYYGAQQLSAVAIAAGIGMLTYQGAGSRIRRHNAIATPYIGRDSVGLRLSGRF